MAERAELHNRLAQEFVTGAVRQVIEAGGGFSDVMVLLETTITAAMLVNAKRFRLSDAASVECVESAVHRATERFAASRNGARHG